jgi:HK97 family phage major capsid protein
MNDLTLQAMRNVVDGFGRPLYTEILDDLAPKLRGYPVIVDNNLASLTASTTAGPVFGHLPSAMVLRMVKGAGLLRLDQRYADFLQVGFIGYQRWDIRSNDLRAAVTVKAAAT